MGRGIALGAAALLLAACGTTVPGTPVPADRAPRLDTGNFATAPRELRAVTAADAWQQEGWLLGDAMVAPWDVDPALRNRPPTGEFGTPLLRAAQLTKASGWSDVLTEPQTEAMQRTPFLTGFFAVGADSATTANTVLRIVVLRFDSATAVTTAVDAAAGATGAAPSGTGIVSGARTLRDDGGPVRTVTVAAPRGDLLILATATVAASGDPGALLTRAVGMQSAKLSQYHPTPNGTPIPAVPMDSGGIMSRTFAGGTDAKSLFGLSPEVGVGDGYISPSTMGLITFQPDWERVSGLLAVEMYARAGRLSITRLGSAGTARRYYATLRRDGSEVTSVPGIPAAEAGCQDVSSGQYQCFVVSGRWAAWIVSPTLPQARQGIAAEYLILKRAG